MRMHSQKQKKQKKKAKKLRSTKSPVSNNFGGKEPPLSEIPSTTHTTHTTETQGDLAPGAQVPEYVTYVQAG